MADLDYSPEFNRIQIAARQLRAWSVFFYLIAALAAAGECFWLAIALADPWSWADPLVAAIAFLVPTGLVLSLAALGWRCRHSQRQMLAGDLRAADWAAYAFAVLSFFSTGAVLLALVLLVPAVPELADRANRSDMWIACTAMTGLTTFACLAGWTSTRIGQAKQTISAATWPRQ